MGTAHLSDKTKPLNGVTSIFSYGTLMFPAVVEALLGRVPEHCESEIRGYARYPVKNSVYPGIKAAPSHSLVRGIFWEGLSAKELAILDTFEDDFYSPEIIIIQKKRTRLYVVPEERSEVLALDKQWKPEHFLSVLSDYVGACQKLAPELHPK